MDRVSRNEFFELLSPGAPPCVSIYMPTRAGGSEFLQDVLRLKNLLKLAEEKLIAFPSTTRTIQRLLNPAHELLNQKAYWMRCRDGFALFSSGNQSRHYRLPVEFQQTVHVGNRYRLRPLLMAVEKATAGYVLALSLDHPQLFRVTEYAASKVDVPGMPEGLDQALNYTSADRGAQLHAAGHFGKRKQAAVFHGQGGKPDAARKDFESYCRMIDKAIRKQLGSEKGVLLLASSDRLAPIYKSVSKYPQLMTEVIKGSPDRLTSHEVHERSWPLLEAHFSRSRDEAQTRFRNPTSAREVTTDPLRIIPAACQGQVETLFVDPNRELWGSFDPQQQVIDVHDVAATGDEELIDLATAETLTRRGVVYPLGADQMPSPAPMAAIFRYGV